MVRDGPGWEPCYKSVSHLPASTATLVGKTELAGLTLSTRGQPTKLIVYSSFSQVQVGSLLPKPRCIRPFQRLTGRQGHFTQKGWVVNNRSEREHWNTYSQFIFIGSNVTFVYLNVNIKLPSQSSYIIEQIRGE